MAAQPWTIFTADIDDIDADLLRSFMRGQLADRLFQESAALEFKREIHSTNVVRAIAALANTAGGIVLLGVDENEPDFDNAPGVPADTAMRVLNQCQSSLTPRFSPEIAPVPIPGTDRVVLVIRVQAQPALLPVALNGQVPIRQPGRTVNATHDQILELVARRSTSPTDAPMYSVQTTFAPDGDVRSQDPTPSFTVRVATAAYARLAPARTITLGRRERATLANIIEESPLATFAGLNAPHLVRNLSERPTMTDDSRSASRYAAHLAVPSEPNPHRISLDVRVSGRQVAFAVDFSANVPSTPQDASTLPVVQRHDFIAAAGCAVRTVEDGLLPVVASWMGGTPAAVDDLDCWVTTANRPFDRAIDLTDADTLPTPGNPWTGSVRQLGPLADEGDLMARFRAPMERLYIDLQVDDEVSLVDLDFARAREVLTRVP
ncbi:hypothetical protein CTKZ_08350 [Cellulomonas algicola]|uniref:Schlafen AlbA-2 domain-containing protein n=1 Tax=Cellulomonas algicola TaxID=2071633 RepID=A0A401UX70_9CELL|nr:ATP-binding protein [Cellulomonas algicola]GCD19273.1 hypothetical protein CTKZ_08350 [Cellulomonas algicola]